MRKEWMQTVRGSDAFYNEYVFRFYCSICSNVAQGCAGSGCKGCAAKMHHSGALICITHVFPCGSFQNVNLVESFNLSKNYYTWRLN